MLSWLLHISSRQHGKHSLHIIDTKINIAKLLLNSNSINIRLYEMQVHILRDQNFTGSSMSHTHVRDAQYTGTGKIPVYIMFQTVRYHNFAQFCISHAAVAKYTCRWQCFQNCCATSKCDNRTTRWIKINAVFITASE